MALALLDLNGDEVVHRQQQFRIFRDRENPMYLMIKTEIYLTLKTPQCQMISTIIAYFKII